MREYTLLVLAFIVIALRLNSRLKVNLFERKQFWWFLLIIFGFKLLVNGYLTGKNIVLYYQPYYLGIRIGSIPLEDFGFGFSMVAITIMIWEKIKKVDKI